MKFMRQCTFISSSPGSTLKTSGWVEEKGAKEGAMVVIEGEDERRIWKIESVSETRLPEEYVRRKESDHRRHRKASDI